MEQIDGGQQSVESFDVVLKELTKIKDDYVERNKVWYQNHARLPFFFFRASGVLVILLSVSIPFLVSLEGFWKNTILPISALTIAGLTGLNSFLKMEKEWQGFRQTQFTLEYLLTTWELNIVEAKNHKDKEKRIEMAMKATEVLLNNARLVTSSESEEFFKRIQFPEIKQSQ